MDCAHAGPCAPPIKYFICLSRWGRSCFDPRREDAPLARQLPTVYIALNLFLFYILIQNPPRGIAILYFSVFPFSLFLFSNPKSVSFILFNISSSVSGLVYYFHISIFLFSYFTPLQRSRFIYSFSTAFLFIISYRSIYLFSLIFSFSLFLIFPYYYYLFFSIISSFYFKRKIFLVPLRHLVAELCQVGVILD